MSLDVPRAAETTGGQRLPQSRCDPAAGVSTTGHCLWQPAV